MNKYINRRDLLISVTLPLLTSCSPIDFTEENKNVCLQLSTFISSQIRQKVINIRNATLSAGLEVTDSQQEGEIRRIFEKYDSIIGDRYKIELVNVEKKMLSEDDWHRFQALESALGGADSGESVDRLSDYEAGFIWRSVFVCSTGQTIADRSLNILIIPIGLNKKPTKEL